MFDYVNYIKSKVESFSETIEYNSISEIDGVYTVDSCNTKSLFVLNGVFWILVNGVQAKVTSIVPNDSFTFEFEEGEEIDVNTITEIKIKPYYHYYGTAITTNEELAEIQGDASNRVPMVWHVGTYNIVKYFRNPNDSEAEIRLVILNQANFQWSTLEHHNNVIVPIKTYAENFVNYLRKDKKNVFEIGDYTSIEYARFGEYTVNGTRTKLFNEDTSGVEIRFTMIARRTRDKCCAFVPAQLTIDYSELDYSELDYY